MVPHPQLLQTTIKQAKLLKIGDKCGHNSRKMGLQQYVGWLQELKPYARRHSTFRVGLYGCLWVGAMKFWSDLAIALVRLKPGKLPYFQRSLRAMTLIKSAL